MNSEKGNLHLKDLIWGETQEIQKGVRIKIEFSKLMLSS